MGERTQQIHDYINNIKEFYGSNEQETLKQLVDLIHNYVTEDIQYKRTTIFYNIQRLHKQHVITTNEYEELLKFNLFLDIITSIQNNDKKIYWIKRAYKYGSYEKPIIIDGKQYWTWKDYEPKPYKRLLAYETEKIIEEITKICIMKYFVLDKPENWISKDRLELKIANDIKEMCKYFMLIRRLQHMMRYQFIYLK